MITIDQWIYDAGLLPDPLAVPVYGLGSPVPVGYVSSCGSCDPVDRISVHANIQFDKKPVIKYCEYCGSAQKEDYLKCCNCGAPRLQ